jgi:hypothetical protein
LSRLDCSELSLKISDWAMSISAETGAKDIDSVVKEMQKTVPTMNRAMVVDSIVEATQGRAQQTDELTKDQSHPLSRKDASKRRQMRYRR